MRGLFQTTTKDMAYPKSIYDEFQMYNFLLHIHTREEFHEVYSCLFQTRQHYLALANSQGQVVDELYRHPIRPEWQ